jgi:molybdopterin-guanine dinucleotide biosynthesis protein A
MKTRLSVIVLAGGKSRRMGKDKSKLPFGDLSLLEFICVNMRSVTEDVVIAGGDYQPQGTRLIKDIYPAAGPLGGICGGLKAADHELSLVLACDNPFILAEDIDRLLMYAPRYDMTAPLINGRIQVLCALYRKTCLKPIEYLLAEEEYKISGLCSRVKTALITEKALGAAAARMSANINTPEEYDMALLRHKEGLKR